VRAAIRAYEGREARSARLVRWADAASAIDDLDGRVSDLEDSVDSMQNEAGGSTLETDVEDTMTKLSDLCDAFANYSGAFEDIYLSAC
jgi:hypothetical protein